MILYRLKRLFRRRGPVYGPIAPWTCVQCGKRARQHDPPPGRLRVFGTCSEKCSIDIFVAAMTSISPIRKYVVDEVSS